MKCPDRTRLVPPFIIHPSAVDRRPQITHKRTARARVRSSIPRERIEKSIMPTAPDLPPIHTIRRQRVVLDSDLARLYGMPTFRLNEAIKRNVDRFPGDFRFQLTREEYLNLISQNAISSSERSDEKTDPRNL